MTTSLPSDWRLDALSAVAPDEVATCLAECFGDRSPPARAAWLATVRDDLRSGRCDGERSPILRTPTGDVVAAAMLYGAPEISRWRLGAIGVLAPVRREGAGARLVKCAQRRLAAAGGRRLGCEVELNNVGARRFFESCGFETEGTLTEISLSGVAEPGPEVLKTQPATFDEVASLFSASIGLRHRYLVDRHARDAGAWVVAVPKRGAAVVRGRWLIDLALRDSDDIECLRALLTHINSKVNRVVWRQVPADSELARQAAEIGATVVPNSVSMVRSLP